SEIHALKWSTKTGHRVRVFSSIDFPTYADEQCTHVLTEEDFFSTEEREGVDRCIGVICSSVSYELFPNVHEDGGVGYQFLYEGDELKCYEHGLLIESVE
ncbi:hypothetical protein ACUOBA_17835, partial [Escherichia coli]